MHLISLTETVDGSCAGPSQPEQRAGKGFDWRIEFRLTSLAATLLVRDEKLI